MQENTQAAELRALFKRIYRNSDGKQQFTNIDNDLTHAVIQTMLYNIVQYCEVSMEHGKCINDGTNAFPMLPEEFLKCNQYNQNNPGTRAAIKPETFHFYDCVVVPSVDIPAFNKDGFNEYKQKYDRAQLILCGSINVDGENIPQEVKEFISQHNAEFINQVTENKIKNANSAKEIKDLLEKIVEGADASQDEFKNKVSKFIESDEFKKEYEKAEAGYLEMFKNWIIKAIVIIKESLQWLLSGNSFDDLKGKCSKKFKQVDSSVKQKSDCFRSYVLESDKSPFNKEVVVA